MLGGNLVTRSLVGNRVVGGTWTLASGATLTLPAVTLGGTLTLNGQVFNAGSGSGEISTTGGSAGLWIRATNTSAEGPVYFMEHISSSPAVDDLVGRFYARGRDNAGNIADYGWLGFLIEDPTSASEEGKFQMQLLLGGGLNTVLTISSGGALWTDLSVDTLTYKVSGTQVVGARVVDARCDDVVDATYGAEEAGVLDALRDAMITHGLISAA